MKKPSAPWRDVALALGLFLAALLVPPLVHRIVFPIDPEYYYGISRANEDAILPSLTATVLEGEGDDSITCGGNRGTKVRLRPYTVFMIPKHIVFVCAIFDESGNATINRAGRVR